MKYLYLFILLAFAKLSYSQCNILLTSNDFVWCQPCTGSASVIPSNGTPPYTYLWSTNDTTSTISNLCTGTYVVTVTDSLGCSVVDSVTISQIGIPMTVSTSSTAPSCSNCCDICIISTPTGGCSPYNYTWSPSDPNWPSPCIACAFQTYNVTVTDACGCSVVDSITTDTVSVLTGLSSYTSFNIENIIIYPNPSNDFFQIRHHITDKNAFIQVITLQGEILKTFILKKEIRKYNIQDLPKGVYSIRILTDKKVYSQMKLIKE